MAKSKSIWLGLSLDHLTCFGQGLGQDGQQLHSPIVPFFPGFAYGFSRYLYSFFHTQYITIYPIISPQIHAPSMKLTIFELSVPDVIPSCRTRRFAAMGRPSACGAKNHHKMREDHTQTGGLQGDMSRTGQEIVEPAI